MQHLELSGTPFEMGLQHGRRLAGLIVQVIEQTCQFPRCPPFAAHPATLRRHCRPGTPICWRRCAA